jgi:putative sigma-54 modulation protein
VKYQFFEKKVDGSDALREYSQKKIGKLDKFFKEESDASISFVREGGRFITEVTLHNDGLYFRAKSNVNDFYAAIDSNVSAIERQIHKYKTKLEKRLHKGAFEREIPATDLSEITEETEFPIIRSKRFDFKPMTPEEAILQMNLLNHQFYIFRNSLEKSEVSVVYHRNDGGYGLIGSE